MGSGTLKEKTQVEAPGESVMGAEVDGPTLLEARGLGRKFGIVLWKNGVLKRRHWITTTLEIIIPTGTTSPVTRLTKCKTPWVPISIPHEFGSLATRRMMFAVRGVVMP